MFDAFGKLVTRWWWVVILLWIVAAIGIQSVAPRWDDITNDGDVAYLPHDMPSFVGEQLLSAGFPRDRAQSQIVLVAARNNGPLSADDLDVASDIARRFKNYQGVAAMSRATDAQSDAAKLRAANENEQADELEQRADRLLTDAERALDEAIELDSQLMENYEARVAESADVDAKPPARLAEAYWNRAQLLTRLQRSAEAEADRAIAVELSPELADQPTDALLPPAAAELPLLDVWTWRDELVGAKLGSQHAQARLVVLQLKNEFMATDNIRVLKQIEHELEIVKRDAAQTGPTSEVGTADGLQLGVSGSAAIGGDALRSAQESIKHTELFTVVIVVLILLCVYRSPLLIVVPLVTIWVSLQVSMGIIALLTQLNVVPGFAWWDLKVFTTTKIYIVVILFGSGTDFCLFLIARFKEELQRGSALVEANGRSLAAIADALIASAMTTILGLGMMFFADFGKFSNSGPVIGLCLFVTLVACLTLAPALMRACGKWLFWPFHIKPTSERQSVSRLDRFWEKTADWILAYPGTILIASVLLLAPVAWHGLSSGEHVTYDFLSGMDDASPSKSGLKLLQRHFPVGESGPITVVVKRPFEDPLHNFNASNGEGRAELKKLTDAIRLDHVVAIRSVVDPHGQQQGDGAATSEEPVKPSKRRRGIGGLLRRYAEQAHRRTTELYVSQTPGMAGELTRMEVVLNINPLDIQSLNVLDKIDAKLKSIQEQPDSYWKDATFAYSGATAGLRDMRTVTRGDNQRIQILVVVAVYLVLLALLRRPLVCLYMILSVLFSYYVTIGATEALFHWAYGAYYPGLDWKVPLFLFVILVAVGEDYNVYLATRVYEEQKRHGLKLGLRKAIVRTGGIITSCGVIMAGTFASMTAGVWPKLLPGALADVVFPDAAGALRPVIEMGVALTLGVLLDTFIVRPILVPAFMALMAKWQVAWKERRGNARSRSQHDTSWSPAPESGTQTSRG